MNKIAWLKILNSVEIIVIVFFLFLLSYECQNEILDTSVSLMLTLNVKNALPLDAHRRQMPSTGTLLY